jgi:hypothetical protein
MTKRENFEAALARGVDADLILTPHAERALDSAPRQSIPGGSIEPAQTGQMAGQMAIAITTTLDINIAECTRHSLSACTHQRVLNEF